MENHAEIETTVFSKIDEKIHWHIEFEFIYVIAGTCEIEIEEKRYRIPQNEMILINSGKKHSLASGKESLICRIYFPYHLVCRYQEEDYVSLRLNSAVESSYKYEVLRGYIRELLTAYADGEQQAFLVMGTEYKILDYLLHYFQADTEKSNADNQYWLSKRLSQILNYIYANYDDTVSLTEIAEKVYMTPSSLSRFFKKATGESFVQYVRKIRLQRAADALAGTQLPISRIAVNNGFSNPSAMNKDFKEFFGVTPTEYRENHSRNVKEDTKERQKLREIMKETQIRQTKEVKAQEVYHIDVRKTLDYRMWKNRVLNVGPAYLLEAASMRKQLLILKNKIGYEYVRIWNWFSEQMLIYGVGNRGTANFNKIDGILDFCVENHIKVFFDLEQRTNKAMASNEKMIYHKEEGILFHSEEEWAELLERLMHHLVKRYGKSTAGQWIFEFTFFLNERPYFESNAYSTRTVWNRGYQIVKRMLPEARVAGPGLLVMPNDFIMKKIIKDFLSFGNMPDIFTTMDMSYSGELESGGYQRILDEDFLGREIQMIKEILEEENFQNQYYITDWSNSMANRNYLQDSCHKGTYILKNVTQYSQEVDAMGIWYATDLLNEYYDSGSILSGSAGLMTKDGICKPSLYAFEFLNSMGEFLLEKGENYLVTKDERGDIQILVFHNKELAPVYFMVEEDSHRPDKLEHLFTNQENMAMTFSLEHLEPDCQYTIRQRIINPEYGSVLDKWVELECTEELRPEDIEYLKNVSVPKIALRNVISELKGIRLEIVMRPHEMRWISVERQ